MKIRPKPQIIVQGNVPVFAIIPYKDYEEIMDFLEEHEDVKAVDEFRANGGEAFPHEIAEKIAKGKSPVRVLREYRDISQIELAKRIGISRQYLNQIEGKTRNGNVKVLKKISEELNVPLDLLVK